MHMLLAPVNAGLGAAKHVFCYLRYHAAGPRRREG